METTHDVSREKSETITAPPVSTEGGISRKALITFISGAAVVFSIAVYYCVTSNHAVVGAILAGAFCVISVFALSAYKSFK